MLLFRPSCIQSRFKHLLAAAFAFALACRHTWSGRRARARRYRITTDVLSRLICCQLVGILTATAHGWRFFHGFAVLILSPGCSHLLPAGLRLSADLVLISFLFH